MLKILKHKLSFWLGFFCGMQVYLYFLLLQRISQLNFLEEKLKSKLGQISSKVVSCIAVQKKPQNWSNQKIT